MTALKLIYTANILVAGWIGIYSIFLPKTAMVTVFSNAYEPTEVVRLVGCLWLAIALLSVIGLWKPLVFSPVLLIFKVGYNHPDLPVGDRSGQTFFHWLQAKVLMIF